MLKSLPKILIQGRMKASISLLVLLTVVSFYNPNLAKCADTIETVGNVGEVAVPCAAVVLMFAHKDMKGAIQWVESFGTSIATTVALKYTVRETRPNGGSHSFPSAHTMIVFSNAGFMQQRYGWAYGIPAYVVSSFVGYSRIESKNHHFRDVAAGAAIGVIPNLFFTRRFKEIQVTPVAQNNFYGIMIGKRF